MPLVNQTRWEFIPSGEELVPSDREPVHLFVLNSYSIISTLYITVVSSKPSFWTRAPTKGQTPANLVAGPAGP